MWRVVGETGVPGEELPGTPGTPTAASTAYPKTRKDIPTGQGDHCGRCCRFSTEPPVTVHRCGAAALRRVPAWHQGRSPMRQRSWLRIGDGGRCGQAHRQRGQRAQWTHRACRAKLHRRAGTPALAGGRTTRAQLEGEEPTPRVRRKPHRSQPICTEPVARRLPLVEPEHTAMRGRMHPSGPRTLSPSQCEFPGACPPRRSASPFGRLGRRRHSSAGEVVARSDQTHHGALAPVA